MWRATPWPGASKLNQESGGGEIRLTFKATTAASPPLPPPKPGRPRGQARPV